MRTNSLTCFALIAAVAAACDPDSTPTESRVGKPEFITNGVPTGNDFGAVGAIFFDFGNDGSLNPVCTGSLISPRVFLTAAHCLAFFPPTAQLFVTFVPAVGFPPAPSPVIAAEEFHFDPAFTTEPALATTRNDLGVVILPAGATSGITPLELPPAESLDTLAEQGGLRGQFFLNVGYGVSASSQGKPSLSADGVRKVSKSRYMALTADWLALLINGNATDEGGVCFFDSGGPKFLDGNPTVVLGVTSWVDPHCRAAGFSQRVDTPSARMFLGQFVSLP